MIRLLNKHIGEDIVIFCTGKSIRKEGERINRSGLKGVRLGVNTASLEQHLDYHLFTNNDRVKKYCNSRYVSEQSDLLIGSHVRASNRPKNREYQTVSYTDREPDEPIGYSNGVIEGYYRTSGCLAVMIAHLMGARKIYVAGMDGFTHNFTGGVHFHSDDKTNKNDNKTYKEWRAGYDVPVMTVLNNLKTYGIDFKIITPTIFKNHYESGII
jgi:hypothetical protein